MARKTSLAAALKEAAGDTPSPVVQEEATPKAQEARAVAPTRQDLPPSRQGKKAITGHFDPAVSRQLKQITVDEDTTMQALLAEALNDLFTKYGKKPIA